MRRAALLRPPHAHRWLIALGASLLVHGGLLPGQRLPSPDHAAARTAPAVSAVFLQTRTVAAPVASAAPAPEPAPLASLPHSATRQAATPKTDPPATSSQPAAPLSVPAGTELVYLLRQNGQEGTARLNWQPQSDGLYRLSLERELAGRTLPSWRSEGQIVDGAGLAPSRYAQQRQGRDTRATNFRRDEGVISFSASTELSALLPGVQDRLSGWLQLAAMVAAAPERYPAGSALKLQVVGLRGEAREWVFEVLGEEQVTLVEGLGVTIALHLRRAPLGTYDSAIELWLAPDRGHLPVRVLVGQQDERGWELLLRPSRSEQ
ncbi:hypothetical protein BH11PSE10_BH11PSE10_16750 [soil metagenome]